jgi:hypothetical protein
MRSNGSSLKRCWGVAIIGAGTIAIEVGVTVTGAGVGITGMATIGATGK